MINTIPFSSSMGQIAKTTPAVLKNLLYVSASSVYCFVVETPTDDDPSAERSAYNVTSGASSGVDRQTCESSSST